MHSTVNAQCTIVTMCALGSAAGGLIAIMATLWVLTAAASASPMPPSEAELANQAAAEEDARRLLEQLRVPPGASPSPTEPAGASPVLDKATGLEWSKLIDVTSWWTVPGEPDEALDWIETNPPQESTWTGGGSVNSAKYAAFDWPPVPGLLRLRSLLATVGAGPLETTILRADARIVWFVPRPASERIPTSARVLEVVERHHRNDRTVTIVGGRAVSKIVTLINVLPIAQPDGPVTSTGPTLGCARVRSWHQMQLTFRARQGGPVLAEAHQELPVEYCHPMNLKIHGRPQPPLESSYAVVRVLRPMLARHSR